MKAHAARFRRVSPASLVAVVLLAAILSPIVDSGMRGDDSHVAIDTGAQRQLGDVSFLEFLGGELEKNVGGLGRPQPLGIIEGLSYASAVPERVPYKLGIALLSLLCVIAASRFAGAVLRRPIGLLPVVVVGAALSLQFRLTHDPALGYYTTPQFSILLLLGGLGSYLRFIRGGSRRWYVAALVLALALVLTYEANQPLVLAFACLHLGRDGLRRRGWPLVLPILGIGLVMTIVSTYLHGRAVPAAGYESSLDLIAVAQTAIRQAVSAVPGIYFASGSQGLLPQPTKAEALGAFWRAGLAAALLVGAGFMVRRQRRSSPDGSVANREGALALAATGFVLMSCSGLYISLAAVYQQTIGLGSGHLATFAGTIGFVLIVAAGWQLWGDRLAKSLPALVAVAVAVFAVVLASQYSNLRVVAVEQPGVEQRELVKRALDRGVLAAVDPQTTLYVSSRDLNWNFGNLIFYGGTIDYLVYLRTGRQMDVRPFAPAAATCGPRVSFPVTDCAEPSREVAWLAVRAARGGGSAIVIDGIDRKDVGGSSGRRMVVLARGASGAGATPSVVGTRPDGSLWTSRDAAWSRRALGDGWTRFEARLGSSRSPMASTVTDPASKVDFDAGTPAQALVRLFGTKRLLP